MWYIKLEKDNGSTLKPCEYSAAFREKTPNAMGDMITVKDDRLYEYRNTLRYARMYKDKLSALKEINQIAINSSRTISNDGESTTLWSKDLNTNYKLSVTDDIYGKKQKFAVHKKTTMPGGHVTDEIEDVFNVYYDACLHHGKVAADVVAEYVKYGNRFTLQHEPNGCGATVITMSDTIITVYTERIEI